MKCCGMGKSRPGPGCCENEATLLFEKRQGVIRLVAVCEDCRIKLDQYVKKYPIQPPEAETQSIEKLVFNELTAELLEKHKEVFFSRRAEIEEKRTKFVENEKLLKIRMLNGKCLANIKCEIEATNFVKEGNTFREGIGSYEERLPLSMCKVHWKALLKRNKDAEYQACSKEEFLASLVVEA